METEAIIKEGKRWSGSDWADQQRDMIIVGNGGIGGWLSLCLSRIDHRLFLVDGDIVDATNVEGGQMFRHKDVGSPKVDAVTNICRDFGCRSAITPVYNLYLEDTGALPIMLGAVDNMDARKLMFQEWKKSIDVYDNADGHLLIDGRLNLEDYEILCVQGNKPEQIEEYERKFLFDDGDVADAACTEKQTTFTAMGIASFMTAILCNWLTNKKLGFQAREIPFHTRVYYPGMIININEAKTLKEELV